MPLSGINGKLFETVKIDDVKAMLRCIRRNERSRIKKA